MAALRRSRWTKVLRHRKARNEFRFFVASARRRGGSAAIYRRVRKEKAIIPCCRRLRGAEGAAHKEREGQIIESHPSQKPRRMGHPAALRWTSGDLSPRKERQKNQFLAAAGLRGAEGAAHKSIRGTDCRIPRFAPQSMGHPAVLRSFIKPLDALSSLLFCSGRDSFRFCQDL